MGYSLEEKLIRKAYQRSHDMGDWNDYEMALETFREKRRRK
jgi:hypothetical protein